MNRSTGYGQAKTYPAKSFQKPIASTPSASAPDVAISVVDLTPCRGTGNLMAFATVQIGKWVKVRGFRVVQQPGQAPWCGLPANFKEEPDPQTGAMKKRWFQILDLPDNWKRAAEQAVLDAWAEYQDTGVLPSDAVRGGQGR
nr:hypothetical protein [Armatimonas sp.]